MRVLEVWMEPKLPEAEIQTSATVEQPQLVRRCRPSWSNGVDPENMVEGIEGAVCYVLNLELNLENLKETKYETVTN